MKPQKPITQNLKTKANILWEYMRGKGGYVTKDEVCKVTGCRNERSAREVISVLASVKPIISTSDSRGYKLATSREDLDEVIHSWQEIDSRQAELEKRKKPLIAFYEQYRGA